MILVFVITTITYSCKKNQSKSEEEIPTDLNVSSIESPLLKQNLQVSVSDYSFKIKKIIPEVNLADVDYSLAFVSSLKNFNGEGLGINLLNSEKKNVTFMLTKLGNKIGVPTLVVIKNRYEINYYDILSETVLKVKIAEGKINSEISSYGITGGRIQDAGCGQKTIDCITDAYSNHGWASVWITVQSAVLPQTAVAISAACAAKNCL